MSFMETAVGTPIKRKLLLYVETRCVEYKGALDPRQINSDEIAILQDWDEAAFVDFRVAPLIVRLTDDAWEIAHKLRRERAERP